MTSDHHERRIRVLRRPPPYTRSLQAKTLKSLGYRERLPVSISLYWTWLQRSLRIGLSQWLDFRDQWSVNEQERQGFKALSGNIAIQVYCAPRGWKLPAKLREVFGEWDRGVAGIFAGLGGHEGYRSYSSPSYFPSGISGGSRSGGGGSGSNARPRSRSGLRTGEGPMTVVAAKLAELVATQ